MTNRISFTLPSGEYTLHFGMCSAQIFGDLWVKLIAGIAIKEGVEVDEIPEDSPEKFGLASFANIVFAGWCNYNESIPLPFPKYSDAYNLAEELCEDDELSKQIYACWKNARPTQNMMDRLGVKLPNTGDEATPEKKKKQTGKK